MARAGSRSPPSISLRVVEKIGEAGEIAEQLDSRSTDPLPTLGQLRQNDSNVVLVGAIGAGRGT
jgi:hypothetical protein